jgi:hypothetical protein
MTARLFGWKLATFAVWMALGFTLVAVVTAR